MVWDRLAVASAAAAAASRFQDEDQNHHGVGGLQMERTSASSGISDFLAVDDILEGRSSVANSELLAEEAAAASAAAAAAAAQERGGEGVAGRAGDELDDDYYDDYDDDDGDDDEEEDDWDGDAMLAEVFSSIVADVGKGDRCGFLEKRSMRSRSV